MSARWWTLAVWALASGSALAWGFKVFVTPTAAPPHTQTAAAAVALRGDLTRLLGADPTPSAPSSPTVAGAGDATAVADSRFQLVGVVSPRSPRAAREGLALIVVDGKPAQAFRVGAVVEGATVLQSVAARGATLGPRNGPAQVALNLAPPAAPATGLLPPGGAALLRPSPTGVVNRPALPGEPGDPGTEMPPPVQGAATR